MYAFDSKLPQDIPKFAAKVDIFWQISKPAINISYYFWLLNYHNNHDVFVAVALIWSHKKETQGCCVSIVLAV